VKGLMAGKKDLPYYLTQTGIIALLWLCRVLCHAFSTATSHRATFAVLGEIRKRCTEKLTRMPLGAVLAQSSGALKNTLIARIDSIETTLAHIVPEFTANLLIPVIITVYIFTVDWRMGLASLATVPLGIFFYIWMMATSSGFYQATINNTKALNNTAIFGEVQAILDAPQMDISGEEIQPTSRDIAAKEVVFSYDKKRVIDGISLSIPERTTTAIVGPSGGGKTTLVNLLARFWDINAGSVTLGGRDVRDYDMDSLMQNFSFVFQNVYLFRDTIANNIRFGSPDAPREDVIAAVKKACCHDFITALPDGYDTVIGEGGENLSGGERQRISIARAMMKDAPVIFLDEATANVDPENTAAIILWFALMMTGSARRIEVKRIGSLRFSGLPLITLRLNTSRLGRDAYQLALQRGRTAATQLDQL